MMTRRTLLQRGPAALATPLTLAGPPTGSPDDEADRIIAALLGRFPSAWAAIIHLANDLIMELEIACDEAPDAAAEAAAEALYEREKPRLRALITWAARMDRSDA